MRGEVVVFVLPVNQCDVNNEMNCVNRKKPLKLNFFPNEKKTNNKSNYSESNPSSRSNFTDLQLDNLQNLSDNFIEVVTSLDFLSGIGKEK